MGPICLEHLVSVSISRGIPKLLKVLFSAHHFVVVHQDSHHIEQGGHVGLSALLEKVPGGKAWKQDGALEAVCPLVLIHMAAIGILVHRSHPEIDESRYRLVVLYVDNNVIWFQIIIRIACLVDQF